MTDLRDLTEREREVLRVMVSVLSDETTALADTIRVIRECDCGCATIIFGDQADNHLLADSLVEVGGDSVLLFGWEGGPLTSMEIAWVSDEPPKEFPPPHTLTPRRRA